MSEESKELIVIEKADVEKIFKEGGSKPILDHLKNRLDEFKKNIPDVNTKKGRDAIASFSFAFSRSKTYIDKFRLDLVAERKAKLKAIDNEGKIIRDTCDLFRDEARKPLTDWENAEKERVANIEARIQEITDRGNISSKDYQTSEEVGKDLESLKAIVIDETFEEFELAATKAKAAALTQLEAKFIVLQNAEKEKVEAERLEKERLEKEREELEKRIADEAAKRARIEAEEKAKREAEEKERKEKEEKERLEREKLEVRLALEKAEREKKEAEERAEKEKKEAAEKAEREKKEAVETEKRRQEEEKRREAEDARKREENKRHRNKIIGEIIDDLKASNISEKICREGGAKELINAVLEGKIRHLKIEF